MAAAMSGCTRAATLATCLQPIASRHFAGGQRNGAETVVMYVVGEVSAHISRGNDLHSGKVRLCGTTPASNCSGDMIWQLTLHLRISKQSIKARFTMLAPPLPVFVQAPKKNFTVTQCTCGAKDFKLRERKHNHTRDRTSEAKQAANCPAASPAKLRRSFWRKLLGKGPKCVCPKRTVNRSRLIVGIPAAYTDCDTVTVAGRRVPFTLDMQQRRRGSWKPLDAISEDE